MSGPNPTFDPFVERNKGDWDTGTEVIERDLIQNDTEKYNNMVAEKNGLRQIPRMLKLLHYQLVFISKRKTKLMYLHHCKEDVET